jgi:hypothetical protein
VDGLVNGDAVSAISLISDGAAAAATVAGSPYAILAGGATGAGLDNYNILYADGQMTVGLRELTITATDQGKNCGRPDPELTYTISEGSLADGHSITGQLFRAPGEIPDTYEISIGSLTIINNENENVAANYNIIFHGASLMIIPNQEQIIVLPEELTLCNSGTVYFGVSLENQQLLENFGREYQVEIVYSNDVKGIYGDENESHVITGLSATGSKAFFDELVNSGNGIETVTFTFTSYIIFPDGVTICPGVASEIFEVKVNPTPKVIATPELETICDGGTTEIELTTPTTVTSGVVTFDYTAVASDPAVTGFTGSASGLVHGDKIEDTIINATDQPQTVTYTITPRAIDTGCADGAEVTVVVTINPTPGVIATPELETICDGGTTDIELTTSTTVTSGVVTFDYTAVASDPAVTGFTGSASGLVHGDRIEDTIINATDQPQTVTYTITPRAIDTGCADGVIATPELETICDGGTTSEL